MAIYARHLPAVTMIDAYGKRDAPQRDRLRPREERWRQSQFVRNLEVLQEAVIGLHGYAMKDTGVPALARHWTQYR